jgi:hypothetical protein
VCRPQVLPSVGRRSQHIVAASVTKDKPFTVTFIKLTKRYHSTELSIDTIKMITVAGYRIHIAKTKNSCKVLVRKSHLGENKVLVQI